MYVVQISYTRTATAHLHIHGLWLTQTQSPSWHSAQCATLPVVPAISMRPRSGKRKSLTNGGCKVNLGPSEFLKLCESWKTFSQFTPAYVLQMGSLTRISRNCLPTTKTLLRNLFSRTPGWRRWRPGWRRSAGELTSSPNPRVAPISSGSGRLGQKII